MQYNKIKFKKNKGGIVTSQQEGTGFACSPYSSELVMALLTLVFNFNLYISLLDGCIDMVTNRNPMKPQGRLKEKKKK